MEAENLKIEEAMKKNAEVKKEKKRGLTPEQSLYWIGWIMLLILVLIAAASRLWTNHLGGKLPPCYVHLLTGFYCPGCGGTRAILALLGGHPLRSFLLHPLVPYTALVGGWFMISQTIERLSGGRLAIGMKYREWWMWGAVFLVGLHFVGKNVLLLVGVDVLKALTS